MSLALNPRLALSAASRVALAASHRASPTGLRGSGVPEVLRTAQVNKTTVSANPARPLSSCFSTAALRRSGIASSAQRSSLALKSVSSFSTMSSLNSNAPPVAGNREYDPEITDIANYIHNYKIDSPLAVRRVAISPGLGRPLVCMSISLTVRTPCR